MRAGHTQSLLASVRRLPQSERASILEATGSGVADIDGAIALSWLPMTLHMKLSDALRDVVGAERNQRIWRSTMDASYERPLLRGFVTAAVDLFGATPLALFRQAKRIYGQLTRGLGDLTFEPSAVGSGMVQLRAFPAKEFRFVCYIEGLAGCLESTIAIARAVGEVTVVDVDESRGDVSYRVKWERRTMGTA